MQIFSNAEIRTEEFNLIREAVVSHLVGILVHNHRGIGSGVLVRRDGRNFVLTAHHVVKDVKLTEARFAVRGTGSLAEVGSPVQAQVESGSEWPIRRTLKNAAYDIAALELGFDAVSPPSCFYEWNGTPIELPPLKKGTSLIYAGFPKSTAIPIGGHVGVVPICDDHTRYDPELYLQNKDRIARTEHDPSAQILIPYLRHFEGIEPHGFSGCGVWARREAPESPIWQPQLMLIGIAFGYIEEIQALNVTCMPAIARMFDQALRPESSSRAVI